MSGHTRAMLLKLAALLFACSLGLVMCATAHATDAPLSWSAPTLNVDGSPLTDLAGYRIYDSSLMVMAVAKDVTAATVPNLTPGSHSLTLTAFNAGGVESQHTSAVIVVADTVPECGSTPPPETRSQTCPAPTIGSYTQSHGWTLVAAPACWQALPWTPDTAPAGVCATPALSAADTKAYELRSATLPLAFVGLVRVGQPCGPETQIRNGVKYCRVPLWRPDGALQIAVVVWPQSIVGTDFWVKAAP